MEKIINYELDEVLFLQTRMKSQDISYKAEDMKLLLKSATRLLNDKLNSKRSGGLHISAVGYCPRKIFLDTAGFNHVDQEEFSIDTLRTFQHGHEIHELLGKWFEMLDVNGDLKLIGLEIPIPDNEWGVRGTCDGIIEWNGKKYIIEFKSISEKSFNYMTKNTGNCKPEHFFQSIIYAGLHKCEGVLVIYFSKNTEQVEVYIYNYDDDSFNNAINKYKYLSECLNQKKLPKTLGENSFKCKWCDKKNCCYKLSDLVMLECCEKLSRWNE